MPYVEFNPYHRGRTVIIQDEYKAFHEGIVTYTNGYSYHIKCEDLGIVERTRPQMDYAHREYVRVCHEHREMVRWQRDSSAVD